MYAAHNLAIAFLFLLTFSTILLMSSLPAADAQQQDRERMRTMDPSSHNQVLQERWRNQTETTGMGIHAQHMRQGAETIEKYPSGLAYTLTANGTAISFDNNGTENADLTIQLATWKANNRVVSMDILNGTITIGDREETVQAGHAYYLPFIQMVRIYGLVPYEGQDGQTYVKMLRVNSIPSSIQGELPTEDSTESFTFDSSANSRLDAEYRLNMTGQVVFAGSGLAETNQTVTAAAGDEFTVELESNPSTGYEWQVTEIADEQVVRLLDSEYVPPESELLGASGKQVFTFEALQNGTTTIILEYARPFEDQPISRHVVEVTVSAESGPTETNETVTASADEEFTVELDSNPSTGYGWNVTRISDEDIVRLVNSEYIPPESDLLGASGKEVFTFEALENGTTTITLEYARSFEDHPISRHIVNVTVS